MTQLFNGQPKIVYFLTKKRGTKQFNQVYRFKLICLMGNALCSICGDEFSTTNCLSLFQAQCKSYRIKLELFEITVGSLKPQL